MSQKTISIMKECAPIFSMLQDDRRQEIMQLLFDYSELSVTELTDQLLISRPAVSHHLKLLLTANLVTVRQSGKERYYKINLLPALGLLKDLTQSIEDDMSYLSK